MFSKQQYICIFFLGPYFTFSKFRIVLSHLRRKEKVLKLLKKSSYCLVCVFVCVCVCE